MRCAQRFSGILDRRDKFAYVVSETLAASCRRNREWTGVSCPMHIEEQIYSKLVPSY